MNLIFTSNISFNISLNDDWDVLCYQLEANKKYFKLLDVLLYVDNFETTGKVYLKLDTITTNIIDYHTEYFVFHKKERVPSR